MDIFESIKSLILHLKTLKKAGKKIGFVPTMGALHDGHLSLIQQAQKDNEVVVCSIFINPLQFNNTTDLQLYPKPIDEDLNLLQKAGCTVLFLPTEGEMYAIKPKIKISFGALEQKLEGKHRPGHFAGVGLVITKFFNIIQPDNAYFGQKDLQQFLIIQQLVRDFSYQIQLHCCPIIREPDGLAMSSRNRRISKAKRKSASKIHEALQLAQSLLPTKSVADVKADMVAYFATLNDFRLEYFDIVDGETLAEVRTVSSHKQVALCLAAYLEDVRLIDNIFISN